MDINQMLNDLEVLNATLNDQGTSLVGSSRRIADHAQTLRRIDGGTGNSHTRNAVIACDRASTACQQAALALNSAKADAIAYIASVRR